jgi:hypothetical protein
MSIGQAEQAHMRRAKKKQSKYGSCPIILRTPINVTFERLLAKCLIDLGKQPQELSEALQDAWKKLNTEVKNRVFAAADFYGFDHGFVRAQNLVNAGASIRLFSDLFPDAFSFEVEGQPVKPRKNGWSVKKKVEFMDFVDHLKRGGLTETQACRVFSAMEGKALSTTGLIARYHEVKRWFSDPSSWTTFDRLELLNYLQSD